MHNSERRTKLKNLEPSSFSRLIYSEIEEIGWDHLVHFSPDLRFLSFRVTDKNGRLHILEIQLNDRYPHCSPSFSADVPYLFNAKWSANSGLKDLVQQFREHLDKLQEFWSTLDDIDKSLCITDLKLQYRSSSCRKIDAGDKCFLILAIDAKYPRSLPEVRFMGAGPIINTLRKLWQRNSKRWMEGQTLVENLTSVLEGKLPRLAAIQNIDKQIECGICYAQCLPVDDELGSRSGTGTDYTCDNANCSRAFHSVCLQDWLLSITTTRQSFNVLFGNCPYCSEPVAIKIQNSRK